MGSETSPSLVILIKNIYTLWGGKRFLLVDAEEYIYFMGSETSSSLRCKLLTEINNPLQGYFEYTQRNINSLRCSL